MKNKVETEIARERERGGERALKMANSPKYKRQNEQEKLTLISVKKKKKQKFMKS